MFLRLSLGYVGTLGVNTSMLREKCGQKQLITHQQRQNDCHFKHPVWIVWQCQLLLSAGHRPYGIGYNVSYPVVLYICVQMSTVLSCTVCSTCLQATCRCGRTHIQVTQGLSRPRAANHTRLRRENKKKNTHTFE